MALDQGAGGAFGSKFGGGGTRGNKPSPSPVKVSSGWAPVYYPSSSSSGSSSGGSAPAPAPSKRQRNLKRRGRSVSYHGPRTDIARGWGVRVRIGRLSNGSYGIERWTIGGTHETPSWS